MRRNLYAEEDNTEAGIGRDVRDILQGRPVRSENGSGGDMENGRAADPRRDVDLTREYQPDKKLTRAQIREFRNRERQRKREKRQREMPYVFISYAFVFIFLGLIVYLVFFNLYRRDEIQNSSYNRRQDTQAQYVVRGNIMSSDGQTRAHTGIPVFPRHP